jgi:hypothetical protein
MYGRNDIARLLLEAGAPASPKDNVGDEGKFV